MNYHVNLPPGAVLRQRRGQRRYARIVGSVPGWKHHLVWEWIRADGERDQRCRGIRTTGLLVSEWRVIERGKTDDICAACGRPSRLYTCAACMGRPRAR